MPELDLRTVTETRCGCVGSVMPGGELHLSLCDWHSRWVKQAKIIQLGDEVRQWSATALLDTKDRT